MKCHQISRRVGTYRPEPSRDRVVPLSPSLQPHKDHEAVSLHTTSLGSGYAGDSGNNGIILLALKVLKTSLVEVVVANSKELSIEWSLWDQ